MLDDFVYYLYTDRRAFSFEIISGLILNYYSAVPALWRREHGLIVGSLIAVLSKRCYNTCIVTRSTLCKTYTLQTLHEPKLYIIKKKKYILLSLHLMLQSGQIKVHLSFLLVQNAILLVETLFGKQYNKINCVLSQKLKNNCVQTILSLFNI